MCCRAEWKREVVPDHKFDFINVREFHLDDIMTRLKYVWKYILILKSIAVYSLDIFTATTMILSEHWTNAIQRKCGDDCAIDVQFKTAKWVFVGCIIFSFLLLAYETWKARKVVASRDISYAFTNLMANDYYSLKSYDNFCLFCRINNSTKKTDDFAFFIYFTFKDWKQILLADGPRQTINALTLYSFAYANGFQWSNLPAWWDNSVITAMLLFAICFTVLMFVGSLILLIAASIFYVPLLCYIQGNLKEYVCHKVDKRIAELIQKNRRDRIRRNAALEKKVANGSIKDVPGIIPQPTLPNVSLDDDTVGQRKHFADRKGSARAAKKEYAEYEVYNSAGLGYPPTLDYAQPYQTEEYGSSTNLAASAAPMGITYPPSSGGIYNPHVNPKSNPSLYSASQPAFPPRAQYLPQPEVYQRAERSPAYDYAQSYQHQLQRPYRQYQSHQHQQPLAPPRSTSQNSLDYRSPSPLGERYEGLAYDRYSGGSGVGGQYQQPNASGWDYGRR